MMRDRERRQVRVHRQVSCRPDGIKQVTNFGAESHLTLQPGLTDNCYEARPQDTIDRKAIRPALGGPRLFLGNVLVVIPVAVVVRSNSLVSFIAAATLQFCSVSCAMRAFGKSSQVFT
jgi:hypothetical protein